MSRIWWVLLAFVSGCAHWPAQPDTQLTEDAVSRLLQEQQAQQTVALANEWQAACGDIERRVKRLDSRVKRLQQPAAVAAEPSASPAPCLAAEGQPQLQNGKVLVGEVEWLYLPALQQHLPARVDSGAATSSLSATNIVPFERNGKRWVRFTVTHEDIGGAVELESPIERYVRIRQASSDTLERRAVVLLTVSLGEALRQDTEFTLTDRRDMDFPLLLGREFLRDVTLIDVARRYIHPKAKVAEQPKAEETR
ncbi:hypothetical protein CHH28_11680 [Bacterioplanes sanyensis]|uniref:Retropepsin-like aspartic endopeptidase domain-containing protein n=1 Tax=Bacterioplanes sanyensis TaxID=1249553 RepID=A0A222FJS1_9GAMM|nr:ATP-dependent zinc protease [Bacterioplanes sanyensis]ASP39295.1 hypothetical protein CHH28_11680 [Bacterioplanes sanyensis]